MNIYVIIGLVIVAIVIGTMAQTAMDNSAGEQAKKQAKNHADAQLVCPQCHTKGRVHTTAITTKNGISGGKATAAVLTGGVTLLATGLSRKSAATQAHCNNCSSNYQF